VYVEQVSISDYRNYVSAEIQLAPNGITLFQGDNGSGKTNLLEAIAYLSTLRSFRGAPKSSLVRDGAEQAVLRATANRGGRNVLVEAEVNVDGKDKVRLNRQSLRRHEDLLGAVLVTIFSPEDIEIVKGSPQSRRDYLDDLLVALHPKHAAARSELERVLKQRNALLRSANGSLRGSMASTLDIWDMKLATAGEVIAEARESLMSSLQDETDRAYRQLSAASSGIRPASSGMRPASSGMRPASSGMRPGGVGLRYERSWKGPLHSALRDARAEDARRGTTSVGPQRDDLQLSVQGLAARTQASQGEQRSLALSLRLGSHFLVTAGQGTSPVLLLDDVFSELDPGRSEALASCLPVGQTVLTAAGPVPAALPVAQFARVSAGVIYTGEIAT
jgi:DNA replication and repair protein RecF